VLQNIIDLNLMAYVMIYVLMVIIIIKWDMYVLFVTLIARLVMEVLKIIVKHAICLWVYIKINAWQIVQRNTGMLMEFAKPAQQIVNNALEKLRMSVLCAVKDFTF
jgi:hypothetical protein